MQKRAHKKALVEEAVERCNVILSDCFGNCWNGDYLVEDSPTFTLDENVMTFSESVCDRNDVRIDWENVHECLDPASGELNCDRAERKRQQISCLVELVETEIFILERNLSDQCLSHGKKSTSVTIVDFGAGSGHLGLLIAHRNPQVTVILAEQKSYSVNVARKRISELALTNVLVYDDDIRKMKDDRVFHIGVGLHCCGWLTDIALALCSSVGASIVISPCCYGQIAKPPPGFSDLIASNQSTEKNCYRSVMLFGSIEGESLLDIISSGADFSIGFETDFSANVDFLLAKKCMRLIDLDRALYLCSTFQKNNQYYAMKLLSLFPLTCSPKNDIIVGRKVSKLM